MKNLINTIFFSLIVLIAAPISILAQAPGKQNSVAIIQTMYNDFGKGNVPGVLAAMSANVEWSEAEGFPYWEGKPFVGPDAVVKGVFAKLGGEWEYWNLTGLQFHNMDNNMVLATGRYQSKYKKNGATINAQFAHVWTLKDGKVIKFQQYTDTKQVADAIQE
jgi:ketosteroid isomerase-like protein